MTNLSKVLIGTIVIVCFASLLFHLVTEEDQTRQRNIDFVDTAEIKEDEWKPIIEEFKQFQTRQAQSQSNLEQTSNSQAQAQIDVSDIAQLKLLGTLQKTRENSLINLAIVEQPISENGKIVKELKHVELGQTLLPDWELVNIEPTFIIWVNTLSDEQHTQYLFE